ncbi:MAG: ATPase [Alphaproteobacteria bacterium]|jgi:F-type H+-transporting ATPase subunit b|nr:ATPase [Alphaproteobacteria bacterium]MBU1756916.1 ATPase [Alphaproteobacteria bacterium]MBU2032358.1 ATPase [Alphaproteobacteria bacterium]MBU2339784.1 ATPase [Alphaproteobacteria bacterium]
MPQIAQVAETFSSQLFWLLVFFGFTFFVVGRGMVPRVMETVSLRDKQISDDLAAAQSARDRADAEEEAWRERENANRAAAHELIAKAKADAAAQSGLKLAEAQERLDTQLADAEERIDAARTEAMAEVEAVASDAAQDIVRRLAGVEVSRPVATQAVKESLAHG